MSEADTGEHESPVGEVPEAEWRYWKSTESRMEARGNHDARCRAAELRSEVLGENRSRPQNRYGEQAVHKQSLAEFGAVGRNDL